MTFDVKEFRTQFPILNTEANGCRLRYLDNASTTLIPDTVLSALLEFETNSRANVARAGHLLATKATDAYEQARAQIKTMSQSPASARCRASLTASME